MKGTYTLPSGVSRKHIGSRLAFAHEIHDVIVAFLEGESPLVSAAFEYTYCNIAPDSNTKTSSSSVRHGI
jgi:hypothetical protein